MSQQAVFQAAADTLDRAGVTWWLSDGAVLGAVRDGGFVPTDPDVDLGFWDDDYSKVEAAFLSDGWQRYKSTDLKMVRTGVKVDLHPHVATGDTTWFALGDNRYRYTFPTFELGQREFYGRTVNVPSPPERYLEAHYGPDWRTPKPRWRWDRDPPCLIRAIDLGVVTTCWGAYSRLLPEWVASIIAQPWPPSQVTVVDCGMDDPDLARQALEASGLRWQVVEFYRREMGPARNRAVAATRTEWVMHLDADDRLLPTAFDDIETLSRDADVVGVGATWDDRPRLCSASAAGILAGATPPLSPSVFRRELWAACPWIDGDHVESALWLGFAHAGARFAHTTRPGFVYRRHDGSHSVTRTSDDRRFASRQYSTLRRSWTQPPGRSVVLSAAVMAHPDRKKWAEKLATELGCGIVWDRGLGLWDTARRALEAYDPTATHHAVVQDDATLCSRFLDTVKAAAQYAWDHPMGLYIGAHAGGPRARIGQDAAVFHAARLPWVTGPGPLWGVSTVHPVGTLDTVIRLADSHGRTHADDDRLTWAYQRIGVDCWYPVPSLVDHRDGPSLLNNPAAGTGRTAVAFSTTPRGDFAPKTGKGMLYRDIRRNKTIGPLDPDVNAATIARCERLVNYGAYERVGGDAAADSDGGTDDGPPPKTGKGSGKVAWTEYAAGKLAVIPDRKGDIIAALEAAGVPT